MIYYIFYSYVYNDIYIYIHWIYNMIVHGGKDALHDRGTTNKALRFSSARRILEEFGAVQRLCAKHAGAGTIQSVSRFSKTHLKRLVEGMKDMPGTTGTMQLMKLWSIKIKDDQRLRKTGEGLPKQNMMCKSKPWGTHGVSESARTPKAYATYGLQTRMLSVDFELQSILSLYFLRIQPELVAAPCAVSFSLTSLCGFDLKLPQSSRPFSFQRRLRVRQVTLFKYALCLPISWFSEQALKQRHPSIQGATEKGSVHSMNATNLRQVMIEWCSCLSQPVASRSPCPSFNLTLLLRLPFPSPRETKLCPESNLRCLKMRSICQDSPCCMLLASSWRILHFDLESRGIRLSTISINILELALRFVYWLWQRKHKSLVAPHLRNSQARFCLHCWPGAATPFCKLSCQIAVFLSQVSSKTRANNRKYFRTLETYTSLGGSAGASVPFPLLLCWFLSFPCLAKGCVVATQWLWDG